MSDTIFKTVKQDDGWQVRMTWMHPPHRVVVESLEEDEAQRLIAFIDDFKDSNEQIWWAKQFAKDRVKVDRIEART